MSSSEALFKVCIFGDGGVGKTSLVNTYLKGVFVDGAKMTIGVDFHIKRVEVDGKKITLQIWDFAGEDRFRFLLPSYIRGAAGALFMYDITRFSSLKNIEDWMDVFKEGAKEEMEKIPILMIGGKLDLEEKRAVENNEAFEVGKKHKLYGLIECSAKTGKNVEEVFTAITDIMLKQADLS